MKGVKRGCGGFPKPKTAFQAAPFFGKYATTGAPAATFGSALGWMWTFAAHRLVDAFRTAHTNWRRLYPSLRDIRPGA